MAGQSSVEVVDGRLRGPNRAPRNASQHVRGSMHDDGKAVELGFRGGAVAGSLLMNQFPSVLLEAWGTAWFERGSLSLYFRSPTTDGDSVFVEAEQPELGAAQVRTWMLRAGSEDVVAEGTASLGDASASELKTRDLRPCEPGSLRILAGVSIGPSATATASFPLSRQVEQIHSGLIIEPLPWYQGDSPWGGPVLAPSSAVQILWEPNVAGLLAPAGQAVSLFGAIELVHVAGPVFPDVTYKVSSRAVAVGESPKTENLWFDSVADDADGATVATMRMLLRFLKVTSPLYP